MKFRLFSLFVLFGMVSLACGLTDSAVDTAVDTAIEAVDDENGSLATLEAGVEVIEAQETAVAVGEDLDTSGPSFAIDNPEALVYDQAVSGILVPQATQRFYQISVPPSGVATFEATAGTDGGDLAIQLAEMSGSIPGAVGGFNVQAGTTNQLVFTTSAEGGGTYLLILSGGLLGQSDYTLVATAGMQDDAGSMADAPDELDGGFDIAPEGMFTGQLGYEDRADSFRFTVPANSIMTLQVENDAELSQSPLTVEFRSGGSRESAPVDIVPGMNHVWQDDLVDDTLYNVHISGDSGTYRIVLSFTRPDDAGSGGDASDIATEGFVVTTGSTYRAFKAEGDQDCFQFATTAGQSVLVELTNVNDEVFANSVGFRLFDSEGNTLSTTGGIPIGNTRTLEGVATGDLTAFCTDTGGNATWYEFVVTVTN